MLYVPTELRASPIQGVGVFLLVPVKKDGLIWRFDPRVDHLYSEAVVAALPKAERDFICSHGCWYDDKQSWMVCGDNAKYFNHSDNPSTRSLGCGPADDVAAYDLAAGTELTSDYHVICDLTRTTGRL